MTPYCFSYINGKRMKGKEEGKEEEKKEGKKDQNPRPYFIKGSYI